jgi:putative NADH-flavin reductase
MKITIFGSTGNLGQECLLQCLDSGHDITVLVRSPEKIPESIRNRITIVIGDALSVDDVAASLAKGTDAILFAIGMRKRSSPKDLCTNVTKNIIYVMRQHNIPRLVWCGAGSTIQKEDVVTWGANFVRHYSEILLKQKHTDKEHQLALLKENRDLCLIGVRPLQMVQGKKTGHYRLGYNAFSGMSKITFADCAHAMVNMLIDDSWVGKVPIIQY